MTSQPISNSNYDRPIRVLTLRGSDGAGGGAEKIILRNATSVDPQEIQTRVCFIRNQRDAAFDLDQRARKLDIDYCEVIQTKRLDRNLLPALQRVLNDFAPDIVHAHDYKSTFYASRLSKNNSVKPISTLHGWTGHHWREKFIYYPGERLVLRKFPLCLAVSSDIRNTLIRWGVPANRVQVILNGIDPSRYRPDPQAARESRKTLGLTVDDIAIGAVGRLERQKRFDVLIQAFAELKREVRNARLFIAGEGSLQQALQNQIDRLGLRNSCHLLGHRSDMLDLYQGFDLLAQSSDYEGTPTVVVEAMSLRIPVVATDAGGTAELITHQEHGLIVPPRQPSILATAIRQTIENKSETDKRVEQAHRRARMELTFEERTRQLTQAYKKLVGRI